MSNYLDTLATVGIGGVLSALERCQPEDRKRAIPDFSDIVPDSISAMQSHDWNIALHRIALTLSEEFVDRDLVLLGIDIALIEALAAIRHKGHILIIPPFDITASDASLMERNVPAGITVSVAEPGQLPVIPARSAVCVLAFESGGNFLLMEQNAARTIGAIRGQRFLGEMIALLPLGDTPLHDRPRQWIQVPRTTPNIICRPDEIEPIQPSI